MVHVLCQPPTPQKKQQKKIKQKKFAKQKDTDIGHPREFQFGKNEAMKKNLALSDIYICLTPVKKGDFSVQNDFI